MLDPRFKGEKKIISMARQSGKSNWTQVAEVLRKMMEDNIQMKIVWTETARNTLTAKAHGLQILGIREKDMDPIQAWCEEYHCGVRTSFDTFKFRNKKEITMFLLRWG